MRPRLHVAAKQVVPVTMISAQKLFGHCGPGREARRTRRSVRWRGRRWKHSLPRPNRSASAGRYPADSPSADRRSSAAPLRIRQFRHPGSAFDALLHPAEYVLTEEEQHAQFGVAAVSAGVASEPPLPCHRSESVRTASSAALEFSSSAEGRHTLVETGAGSVAAGSRPPIRTYSWLLTLSSDPSYRRDPARGTLPDPGSITIDSVVILDSTWY